jgi:Circularly permutated YpsA SLOG family
MSTIVSGGQTGVDRAALDAAITLGVPYGGWCPKGGWAEDLPTPPGVRALYSGLRETPERAPEQRTEWNVRDADRLMVLTDAEGLSVSKGTARALDCAESLGKPHTVIDVDAPDALAQARAWLGDKAEGTLCIAGPRESEAPGISAKARAFLEQLFAR